MIIRLVSPNHFCHHIAITHVWEMSSAITECSLLCAEGGDDAASHLLHCLPGEHHQVLVLAAGQQASPQLGAAHRQLQQLLQRLLQGYRRCNSSLLQKVPRFTFVEYSNCSNLCYEYGLLLSFKGWASLGVIDWCVWRDIFSCFVLVWCNFFVYSLQNACQTLWCSS